MNCANHPDRERAAFCQNCGKPLCTECVRNVGTSVFCEPCLAARVAGTAPPAGFPYPGYPHPGRAGYPPAGPPSQPGQPNPALAALLGFIPGVGAMYNEQYAKGFVHLIVFAVLVSLAHDLDIFHLFAFGWVIYMAVEAYHTAKARRDGTPLPNPFGLNEVSERLGFGRSWPNAAPPVPPTPDAGGTPPDFGSAPDSPPPAPGAAAFFHQAPDGSQTYSAPGAYFHQAADGSQTYGTAAPPYGMPPVPPVPPIPPVPPFPDSGAPYARRFPSAAIWLIALGLIFLIGNTHVFDVFHGRLFGPVLLIGVGVWLFVRRMTATGLGLENDGTPMYRWRLGRALSSSFWVILTGFIWLLASLHILSWERSWPLYVIAAGVIMLFRRTLYPGYGFGYAPPAGPAAQPAAPVTTTSLVPADPHADPGEHEQEGR